jgi:arabinan endo-1,5-alpha-L-arabinosidase
MPKDFTRRQFLRSGLVLGVGLGIAVPGLARLQDDTSTAEGNDDMPFEVTGSVRQVHDPVIIREADTYYLFCTGTGVPRRTSADMIHWRHSFPASVLPHVPAWALEMIPGAINIWAPDISYYNDRFHLYYSVSTFGQNQSVMGLATTPTLDHTADDYGWEDHGLVLASTRSDNYNCIDANLILDDDGVPWLAFGSHWSGIKMRRLDYETGMPSEEDETLYSLASRAIHPRAVEAPFIFRKDDYYYLFVSFDSCCQGVNSTYRVMVGRSEEVTGPYVDRDGVDMMNDGGTQVTFPTERWRGPGHNAVFHDDGVDYVVYHAYDAESHGVHTLRIDRLDWDEDGWPYIAWMQSEEN